MIFKELNIPDKNDQFVQRMLREGGLPNLQQYLNINGNETNKEEDWEVIVQKIPA